MKKGLYIVSALVAVGCVLLLSFCYHSANPKQQALDNYGEELRHLAKNYKLPWSYLMALTVLECSGEKPCADQFQKHIFRQFQRLRSGKIKEYSNIQRQHIAHANDTVLKTLATSWGPFQVMGYHCLGLHTQVNQIRGVDGLKFSVQWVNEKYGSRLRKEQYQDAFHIHNTGIPIPKNGRSRTTDKKYIPNGLAYMEYFEQYQH